MRDFYMIYRAAN